MHVIVSNTVGVSSARFHVDASWKARGDGAVGLFSEQGERVDVHDASRFDVQPFRACQLAQRRKLKRGAR
jgi:hypothetical protein